MYWWNITKTLLKPNDPAWDLLVNLTLGDKVHSNRKKGFMLAREALTQCLKEAGENVSVDHLKLLNYSTLENFPQFTLSLSDTVDCGAAILADRQRFRSVGIDIEHLERPVKDSIIKRVGHKQDEQSLRNIELWCLKEAVFKALMNSGKFEKPVEFSSIQISHELWAHSPSGYQGEWELETVDSFIVARAFLKN